MKLASSNQTKIKEFKSFLGDTLEIVQGEDIKEVQGTWQEVITYKSLMANKDFIVEDTILFVNGVEIVDIRWNVDKLKEGDSAVWKTSLGYNDGTYIHVFSTDVTGFITRTRTQEGFSFDPFFVPNELINEFKEKKPCTLTEMDNIGRKSEFSARINALKKLKEFKPDYSILIEDIPEWNGQWQNT